MTQNQPRTGAGRYSTFNHAPGPALGAPAPAAGDTSLDRYKQLRERSWDMETEAAVQAAGQLVAVTRERFPRARTIVLEEAGVYYAPRSVLGPEGEVLASINNSDGRQKEYAEWTGEEQPASEDEFDASVPGLCVALADHGGKLDGVLTERSPASKGHFAPTKFFMDLDAAAAAADRSTENLTRGIVEAAPAD